MKKRNLLTLILAIVAMMWTVNAQAQDGLVLGMTFIPTDYTGTVTGDGIFGYVHYEAATKTLTLDNAQLENIEDCAFVNNVVDGLTIVVKGSCGITEKNTDYGAMQLGQSVTIKGDGTLTVKGNGKAISAEGQNFIIENCTLKAEGGEYGLFGKNRNTLIIRNATIHANGPEKGSIYEWVDIQLEGCSITSPVGAVIADTPWGVGKSVVLNGEVVKTEVVIAPAASSISRPISAEAGAIREIFSVDGKRLQQTHSGLNILRMTDRTTRKVMK